VQPQGRTADRELARIAHGSHGVVTRPELLAAGVTPEEIKQRLKRGALIRVHHGVYRVGHRAPSREARYLAAVRACGARAVLSGLAAAHLLGLVKGRVPAPEVTVPTARRVRGAIVHRARRLHPDDTDVWLRIPVTSAARTIVDIAACLPPEELARAVHEGGVLHSVTPADVAAALGRRANVRGAGVLREILDGRRRIALSVLEERFLRLLDEAALPLPRTNEPAGRGLEGRRLDAHWPELGVTVELDSYRFHNSRHAWEQDRRREREAHARGDEFRRYTWDDVTGDTRQLIRELRDLLERRRPKQS
jgi:hypothetical protein